MRMKGGYSIWNTRTVIIYFIFFAMAWLTLMLKIVGLNKTVNEYAVQNNKGYGIRNNRRFEVKVVTDVWTQVNGLNETHVFNAYYTGRDDQVRILGVAPTNLLTDVQCTYRCLANLEKSGTVRGRLVQMLDHHGLRHNNIEILCKVPVDCYPAVVSVSANGSTSGIYLRVHYPGEPPAQTRRFSVCYPAIHSNYGVVTELVQSVELDSLLGGEKFILYYKSAAPEVDAVLRMYVDSGVMDVVHWNLPNVDIHYYGQITAIRDCFYRNMHTSKYLVFKDFDEVLLPYKHLDWNGLLEDQTKMDSNAAAFIFRNSFLYKGDPDVSEGMSAELYQKAKAYGLTALLKQHRQVKIWPNKWRSKFIVKPEGVENVEIHMVKALRKGYKSVVLNETDALMFHYKRFVDQKIQRNRDPAMLRFKDNLIERVTDVYVKLNRDYLMAKPMFP